MPWIHEDPEVNEEERRLTISNESGTDDGWRQCNDGCGLFFLCVLILEWVPGKSFL